MAPKGSPRMLVAASLLVTDGSLPVKVALSKAGFTAEEIAKEKKQRQARRRRDFLLKKKLTTKIKGRRAMATLPRSLPPKNSNIVATATTNSNNNVDINEDVLNSSSTNDMSYESESSLDSSQGDMSRFDALIFACSMQKPISESLSSSTTSSLASLSSLSSSSLSVDLNNAESIANIDVAVTSATATETEAAVITMPMSSSSSSSKSVSNSTLTSI